VRATALPLLLSLVQVAGERPGPQIEQAERRGELGPWQYEDVREEYYRSRHLARRRHPVNGVPYVLEGHRYAVMQGQTTFRHREKPLWLVHNFYCTQPAMTAEMPWDCAGVLFILEGIVPRAQGHAREEDGFALVDAKDEVRIEGDFHAVEPHPDLPIFAAIREGRGDSPARVTVHHFDGRTLCDVRDLPLWYLGWRGEPWERIKADKDAVSCLDGTRVPLASPALHPFGAYDDFRFTEEHQYGHGLELWRVGEELVGFLLIAEGLQGDTPTGLLEDVAFDVKTGRISFGARLSCGTHVCRQHRDVPSRDLYRFDGVLRSDRVEGLLTRVDGLHPGQEQRAERVVLKKQREALPVFKTLPAWQQHAQWILGMRGPRW